MKKKKKAKKQGKEIQFVPSIVQVRKFVEHDMRLMAPGLTGGTQMHWPVGCFPAPTTSSLIPQAPHGWSVIQLNPDTNYPELVKTSQLQESVSQDCPPIRCQTQVLEVLYF